MKLAPKSWLTLAKSTVSSWLDDYAPSMGAALSYYFLLSLFPMLLFLTSLLGLIVGQNPQFQNQLYGYIGRAMPGDASSLVTKTVHEITMNTGGWKLAVVGAPLVAWLCGDGSALLLQHDVVAQGEAELG